MDSDTFGKNKSFRNLGVVQNRNHRDTSERGIKACYKNNKLEPILLDHNGWNANGTISAETGNNGQNDFQYRVIDTNNSRIVC
jgi:hypothetical protein